eukprot:EG_transcript_4907
MGFLAWQVHSVVLHRSALPICLPRVAPLVASDPDASRELQQFVRTQLASRMWLLALLIDVLLLDVLRLCGTVAPGHAVHAAPLLCVVLTTTLSAAAGASAAESLIVASVILCYSLAFALHAEWAARGRFRRHEALRRALEEAAATPTPLPPEKADAAAAERQLAEQADSMLNHMLKNIMADAHGSVTLFLQEEGTSAPEHLQRAQQCLDKGMRWCKKRHTMLQVVRGDYAPTLIAVDLPSFAQVIVEGRDVRVTAAPLTAHLDVVLCEIVLDNAIANAVRHGHPLDPQVSLDVSGSLEEDGSQWVRFQLRNRSNPVRRPITSELVARARSGDLLPDGTTGPVLSDRLGLRHIFMAADANDMRVTLEQDGDTVCFTALLQTTFTAMEGRPRTPSSICAEVADGLEFPEGLRVLCIDDSSIAQRLLVHNLRTHAPGTGVDVMGSSPEDVEHFVEMALQRRADVLIIDQNLVYSQVTVLGTDIVRRLLAAGFAGFIAIRSASDDAADRLLYAQSGAHCVLGKDVNGADMVARLKRAYWQFAGDGEHDPGKVFRPRPLSALGKRGSFPPAPASPLFPHPASPQRSDSDPSDLSRSISLTRPFLNSASSFMLAESTARRSVRSLGPRGESHAALEGSLADLPFVPDHVSSSSPVYSMPSMPSDSSGD